MKIDTKKSIVCGTLAVIFLGNQVERRFCHECNPPEQQDAIEVNQHSTRLEQSSYLSASAMGMSSTLSAVLEYPNKF